MSIDAGGVGSRYRWLAFTILAWTTVGSTSSHAATGDDSHHVGVANDAPPNVVLIVADDLGYGELGCYGQERIRTPRLDELAEQGMRFTQFYAGSPVCAPSRCVLLTGKHTGHAAVKDNSPPAESDEVVAIRQRYAWEFPGQTALPAAEVTIASVLRAAGYSTAAIGKWGLGHVGTEGAPTNHGFESFFGYYCQVHAHNHYPRFLWRGASKVAFPGNDRTLDGKTYAQDEFVKEASRFIRDHSDRPFFLYLPLAVPHLSIQAPPCSVESYASILPETPYKHRGYLRHPKPRAGYAAMVTHMDKGIGQLIDIIDDLGMAERTLVLFTSDNGPTFDRLGGSDSDFFKSTAGLRGRKGSVYEGGLRVPLIARWCGKVPGGRVSDKVTAYWDLFPTLCEVGGAECPNGIDGVSLVTTFSETEGPPEQRCLVWDFPGYGGQQALRFGHWKAIRRQLQNGDHRIELYNLKSDPFEELDVAAERPDLVANAKAHFASQIAVVERAEPRASAP